MVSRWYLLRATLSKEDTEKALKLVALLEQQEEAYEFRQPVDFKRLGLDDYPLIIKHPMDLSTLKKKLKPTPKYQELSEVVADLMLIWQNCKTYNSPDSVIFPQIIVMQAVAMEKHMKRFCKQLKIPREVRLPSKRERDEENDLEESGEVTFEEKWELSEQVRKLSHRALIDVVELVRKECPPALEEEDKDKVKIHLDNLNKSTFNKLQDLILQCFRGEENAENTSKKLRRWKGNTYFSINKMDKTIDQSIVLMASGLLESNNELAVTTTDFSDLNLDTPVEPTIQ